MNHGVKQLVKVVGNLDFVFFHLIALVLTFLILKFIGVVQFFPNSETLFRWDAGWYQWIRNQGYIYIEKSQNNTGFFPAFPLFWKLCNLNLVGISIINFIISLLSIVMLRYAFNISKVNALIFLSIPSMMFLYVPYSESLFFLFVSLVLIGLHIDRKILVGIGIFACALTRPTSLFLIPALVISELLSAPLSIINMKKLANKFFFYSLWFCLGIGLVILFQYKESGVWLAYFKTQANSWDHQFKFPGFPLTTWDTKRLLWIDGLATLIGVLSIVLLAFEIKVKFHNPITTSSSHKKVYLTSLSYSVFVLFFILFFNPKAYGENTSVLSINRYMLVSPFMLVLLDYQLRNAKISIKQIIGLVLISLIVWLGFRSYEHIRTFLYFFAVSIYFLLYLLIKQNEDRKYIWITVYCINLILQVWLFNEFMKNKWVG